MFYEKAFDGTCDSGSVGPPGPQGPPGPKGDPGSGVTDEVYNYSGITNPSATNAAWIYTDSGSGPLSDIPLSTEFSTAQYNAVSVLDTASNVGDNVLFQFTHNPVNITLAQIKELRLTVQSSTPLASYVWTYARGEIYNFNSSSWERVDIRHFQPLSYFYDFSFKSINGMANYFNMNRVFFRIRYLWGTANRSNLQFVQLVVSSKLPNYELYPARDILELVDDNGTAIPKATTSGTYEINVRCLNSPAVSTLRFTKSDPAITTYTVTTLTKTGLLEFGIIWPVNSAPELYVVGGAGVQTVFISLMR